MKTELKFHGHPLEVKWYEEHSDPAVGHEGGLAIVGVTSSGVCMFEMFCEFDNMWDDLEDKLIAKLEEMRMESEEAEGER
jgi:hypothetical protein